MASEWEVPLVQTMGKLGILMGNTLRELELSENIYYWTAEISVLREEIKGWSAANPLGGAQIDPTGTKKTALLVNVHRLIMNKKTFMDAADVFYGGFGA